LGWFLGWFFSAGLVALTGLLPAFVFHPTVEGDRMNTSHNPRPVGAAWLAVAAALALLAGCETGTNLNAPSSLAPVETRTLGGAAGSTGAGATGAAAGSTAGTAAQSQVASVDLTRNAAGSGSGGSSSAATPSQRVVYFDYDSFAIKDDYKSVIDAHAKLLNGQSGKRLVIEGHADERGGREYNLALGQKRAEAVLRSLALLGVPEARLEAVSFGQERPAAQGADEAAFARNRRAELKDR
jgi:peptidoglycan-associated lipoprotein